MSKDRINSQRFIQFVCSEQTLDMLIDAVQMDPDKYMDKYGTDKVCQLLTDLIDLRKIYNRTIDDAIFRHDMEKAIAEFREQYKPLN